MVHVINLFLYFLIMFTLFIEYKIPKSKDIKDTNRNFFIKITLPILIALTFLIILSYIFNFYFNKVIFYIEIVLKTSLLISFIIWLIKRKDVIKNILRNKKSS